MAERSSEDVGSRPHFDTSHRPRCGSVSPSSERKNVSDHEEHDLVLFDEAQVDQVRERGDYHPVLVVAGAAGES